MADALAKLTELTTATGHAFQPDDVPFTGIGLRSPQGHRQWTDAYLLYLARCYGLTLASLDTRMVNLDDPSNPALFIVA